MKALKKLRKSRGRRLIAPLLKKAMAYKINRRAVSICEQFASSFTPCIAHTSAMKDETFRIRHNVYSEELELEPKNLSGLEVDEFDSYSVHCYLRHNESKSIAGTVRLVLPQNEQQLIPIQKLFDEKIFPEKLHPSDIRIGKVCEISRLAVPKRFRRREIDRYKGSAKGVINLRAYSEEDLRCFPFIAVGLYLMVASILLRNEINHCYVMVEPRLAKSMKFIGLPFEQVGPVVDYNGKRAPYYLRTKRIPFKLKYGFSLLLHNIDAAMLADLSLPLLMRTK